MMNRALVLIFVLAAAACSDPAPGPSFTPSSDDIARGLNFVGVRKARAAKDGQGVVVTPSFQTDLDLSGDDDNFYLAVHKKTLEKKYFMSAYLKQLFPGAVSYGAATSLGTRVVQFKPQNGKLYVFSADDIKKTSDTFDPQLIVDAYPIITDYAPFNALENAGEYYLVDPSAGQNRFNLYGDTSGEWGVRFETELSYGQRFRKIADGVTFELVFTGYADSPDFDSWQYGENNTLRGSGTLGLALREYKESEGFQRAGTSPHFFYGDIALVPNEGVIDAPSAKWHIYEGMKPIVWKISPQFAEIAADPKYAELDVLGAVKAGVERWNEVFGFEALRAELATADESFADDDVNYLIFDKDPSYGAAFANWRTNPNTGEIRGASVYFNGLWLDVAGGAADASEGSANSRVKEEEARVRPVLTLGWAGMSEARLCTYKVKERYRPKANALVPGATARTKKEVFQEYITHVVLHEVGHTLGLRHNFAGSLLPPSSSVMDYLNDSDSVAVAHPGAYDTDALKVLYGLSKEMPKQPFCNDSGVAKTAYCARFDASADPLKIYASDFQWLTSELLNPDSPLILFYGMDTLLGYWESYLTDVLKFARDPASKQAEEALQVAVATIGVNKVKGAASAQTEAINGMSRVLLRQLFLAPAKEWGDIKVALPTSGPLFERYMLSEAASQLQNEDKLRDFATRRLAVDALKAVQTTAGYAALNTARAALEGDLKGLSGAAALEQRDLIARIQAATSPYFAQ